MIVIIIIIIIIITTIIIIIAAQEQALRTNSIKHSIDKTSQTPLCRLCGESTETVWHIVS